MVSRRGRRQVSAAILVAGLEIARIGVDLLTGKRADVPTATAEIAGHLLKLVPVEDLRAYLDEFDRQAIDAAADLAEEKKLEEVKP